MAKESIHVSKMAAALLEDAACNNPRLKSVEKKFRKQALFSQAMFVWENAADASQCSLEEIKEILDNLPLYIERQLLSNPEPASKKVLASPSVAKKRRLL